MIEHVILPVRDLTAASLSRVARGHSNGGLPKGVKDLAGMERVNEQLLARLVVLIAQYDMPMTLLAYPQHVRDVRYAHGKLRWLCEKYNVSEAQFYKAHNLTSRLHQRAML